MLFFLRKQDNSRSVVLQDVGRNAEPYTCRATGDYIDL